MTERPIPLTDEELAILAALEAEGDGRDLDDELIAALAEGLLPADQRAAAEQRLLASADSRNRLAEAVDALPTTPEAVATPSSARPLLGLAVAALLLLTVGAAVYAAALGTSAKGGSDAALLRAAATLQSSEPELFTDFRPLDASTRAGGAASVERSALRVIRPLGVVLSRRPWIQWTPLPGTDAYVLQIRDDSGDAVASAAPEATSGPSPANLDRGGHYVVEVSAEGPLGPVTARRAFRVATATEAASFEAKQQAAERLVAPDLRRLLIAHLALREDLLVEAEQALALHLYAYPHDEVGRETLDHVRRRLGITGD